jgi:hypothetical protein
MRSHYCAVGTLHLFKEDFVQESKPGHTEPRLGEDRGIDLHSASRELRLGDR